MKTVAHILKSKPDPTVYSIAPNASVFDALKLMAEKCTGALTAMEGEQVVGIITERDYARKIILRARSSKETPVRDIVTSSVMYVRPDHTSEECMVLMTDNPLRHLPVMDRASLSASFPPGIWSKTLSPSTNSSLDSSSTTLPGSGAERDPCPLRSNGR